LTEAWRVFEARLTRSRVSKTVVVPEALRREMRASMAATGFVRSGSSRREWYVETMLEGRGG
jgi:hypothetical protein